MLINVLTLMSRINFVKNYNLGARVKVNQGLELMYIYMLRVTIVAQGNRGSCFIEFIKRRLGKKR